MSRLSELIFAGEPHKITSPYGPRAGGYHRGTDYGTYLRQLAQFAVEEGEVHSAGFEADGAGYYVWVQYPRLGKRFLHGHLAAPSPLRKGDRVRRGTLLGYTGSSGNSTGIHLHLGVRDLASGAYEDPEQFALRYTEPALPQPLSPQPVRLKLGFASPGDMARIEAELSRLCISCTVQEGIALTEIAVSAGDQWTLLQLCGEMGVPCTAIAETGQDSLVQDSKRDDAVPDAEPDGAADGGETETVNGAGAEDGTADGKGAGGAGSRADTADRDAAEANPAPDGENRKEAGSAADGKPDKAGGGEAGRADGAEAEAAGEACAPDGQLAAAQEQLAKAGALALELEQQISALLQQMDAALAALAGREEGGSEWQ